MVSNFEEGKDSLSDVQKAAAKSFIKHHVRQARNIKFGYMTNKLADGVYFEFPAKTQRRLFNVSDVMSDNEFHTFTLGLNKTWGIAFLVVHLPDSIHRMRG